MSKDLLIYIIYHKNTYPENTSSFSDLELRKHFVWVAVNESILKIEDKWIPSECLVKEWELNTYLPLLQMSNFYQNSVFFHLYWNKDLLKSKYIGFAQYDMNFSSVENRNIFRMIENDVGDKVFGSYPYNFQAIYGILTKPMWEEYFLNPYNEYYNTSHSFNDIEDIPLFLLHTFIIPKWFFLHMMGFVEKMYIGILRALQWNTRHLAGTMERVFALCISFGIKENKFRLVTQWDGVNHIDTQRVSDPFRGIIS